MSKQQEALEAYSESVIELADYKSYAIIDNNKNKVLCHFLGENGSDYCKENIKKIVNLLNNQPLSSVEPKGKTAEEILKSSYDKNVKPLMSIMPSFEDAKGQNGYDWIFEAMQEYASQQQNDLK